MRIDWLGPAFLSRMSKRELNRFVPGEIRLSDCHSLASKLRQRLFFGVFHYRFCATTLPFMRACEQRCRNRKGDSYPPMRPGVKGCRLQFRGERKFYQKTQWPNENVGGAPRSRPRVCKRWATRTSAPLAGGFKAWKAAGLTTTK